MGEEPLAILGRISSPYGVKGWLRIYSYTDPIKNILSYREWILVRDEQRIRFGVAESRLHGKGIIARLTDCSDREMAADLVGSDIAVEERLLPALSEGEYYWRQLIGLEVIGHQGRRLGQVTDLIETGANDVLVVKVDSEQEMLIPFVVGQVVKSVNLATQMIQVDWDPEF